MPAGDDIQHNLTVPAETGSLSPGTQVHDVTRIVLKHQFAFHLSQKAQLAAAAVAGVLPVIRIVLAAHGAGQVGLMTPS